MTALLGRACAICGGAVTVARRRYCAEACTVEATLRVRRAYEGRRQSRRRAAHAARGCARCGLPIGAGRQRYCSDACQQRPKAPYLPTLLSVCDACGTAFRASSSQVRYCSATCRTTVHEARQSAAPVTGDSGAARFLRGAHWPRDLFHAHDLDAHEAARRHEAPYWYEALARRLRREIAIELGRSIPRAERKRSA